MQAAATAEREEVVGAVVAKTRVWIRATPHIYSICI